METILFNGRIYTMTEDAPLVEAIAVGGGRIVRIGTSAELIESAGPQVRRIDLRGHAVIPGLVDAHAHFLGYAKGLDRIDCTGTKSFDEVLELVRIRLDQIGPGEWIVGRGWDQNDWDVQVYPDRRTLDRVVPNHPVLLSRICGHAALANGPALELAGITIETPDPPGGKILRGEGGEPTGILIDEAKALVSKVIPPVSRERKRSLLEQAAARCLAVGLVGVHEMGISSETASIYEELIRDERLPFRIDAYLDHDDEAFDSSLAAGPRTGFGDHRFSVVGVKCFADGSLGARSAALLEDYSDDPGNRGLLVTEPDTLRDLVARAHRNGFQLAVHAIGDRANRIVLDIFERIQAEYPRDDTRHRIEHAQIISPDDIPRFDSLGVIPSMQFTHCTSDMPWAPSRLGDARLAGAYAWRSLMTCGSRIPGGSDFPVESINPFLGLYAAVTRMDVDGVPEKGWMPDQRLSVEEAVRAFTVEPAYAVHQEGIRGRLAPGQLADFIVLSEDVLDVPPRRIPSITVLVTFLGGEAVYTAPDSPLRL